jgi:uncharacterized protein (TIGR02646 family)
MKKVIKNTTPIPKPLNNCATKIKKALQEKGNHKFSNSIYASNSVKQRLAKIYNNKCAFCESDTTAGAVLQVEHYRPKAGVTEETAHEGYYWLGYEWTNLLYACSSCNRAKSTSFPINGTRVFNPPMNGTSLDTDKCKVSNNELKNEKPLILNPEEGDFNPMIHFVISPNGKIRKNSNRGDITINKCKLDRKNLEIARKKVVNKHLRGMMKDFERLKDGVINQQEAEYGLRKEIEEIIDRINKNEQYTLLARYMLKYFDYFFIRRFQPTEQIILKGVFNGLFQN